MSKSVWRSFLPGVLVFICALILPYLGNRDFLWFTIDGSAHFASSGTLYLISPPAMPVVLILWVAALYGLVSGIASKRSDEKPLWTSKAGLVLGIANVLILGWMSIVWPLFTWWVMGSKWSL
ncbi:MAG: hypothetical protein ACYC27_14390 [Armatimonadota bacterium]